MNKLEAINLNDNVFMDNSKAEIVTDKNFVDFEINKDYNEMLNKFLFSSANNESFSLNNTSLLNDSKDSIIDKDLDFLHSSYDKIKNSKKTFKAEINKLKVALGQLETVSVIFLNFYLSLIYITIGK